jgi:hypothetical protein
MEAYFICQLMSQMVRMEPCKQKYPDQISSRRAFHYAGMGVRW